MNDLNTLYMNLVNVLGALDSLNGIIIHSYNSWWVLKVIFLSSLSLILIWWYSLLRSILDNTLDPANWSNMSSRHSMENLHYILIWLMAWLSTHILYDLLFFGLKGLAGHKSLYFHEYTLSLATPPLASITFRLL